jgi:hypothetical protein
MCLWCCWKDLDEQDLIEKSVENAVTLGPTAQATLVFMTVELSVQSCN